MEKTWNRVVSRPAAWLALAVAALALPAVSLAGDDGHLFDISEDLIIPWIVAGPGTRSGHTIDAQVEIMDTAPTLLHLMGISTPDEWTGKVVSEIFPS